MGLNHEIDMTMKRVKKIAGWLMALAAVMICALGVSAKDDAKASITFKETVHNFGNVREDGGPVSCELVFENTGNANLVIVSATAECGCTMPEFPKEPIAPGKKGKIKVIYNPLGRPGGFDKVVTVKTNGKPGKVRLKVRGTVIPKN